MKNRGSLKRMLFCSACLVGLGFLSSGVGAVTTITSVTEAPSSVSGERFLRGDLIEYSNDRKLITSVGVFEVPAAAKVRDQREKSQPVSESKSEVMLKFRNDYLIEVTIY
ncbi:hypothetical protein [Marinobacter sp. ELB17]|uniref:hypothetical protein n=1 Tax=Marinobacter sp. ELB17 TaxID=270374 RepID=UPI0000F3ADB3|nr:hypothetical protein [Marinobacter sp. ELB17]EAZ99346.1 hypothetical protein MELB17_19546 [Marinobacter sp. ELB17]